MQTRTLAALSAIVFHAFAAEVTDVEGRTVQLFAPGISVLIFTRTDCPISNRYAPEINRLSQQFQASGVRFALVYVDAKGSPEAIRSHLKEFGYSIPAILDRTHELVRRTGVRSTPEVAVYREGALAYRGRIDDRYPSVGVARPAAASHDLSDVLEHLTKGGRLSFRNTKAVGCAIEDVR